MSDASWVPAVHAVTLVVADLGASRTFYASVFPDAPAVFANEDSLVLRFGPVLINLLLAGSADELFAPSPVGTSTDAPKAVLTVEVPDTDAYCADLLARGVPLLNGPMTRPWGPRTASVLDPDGHVWEIAS